MKKQECEELRDAFEKILDRIGPAFKQLIYEEMTRSGVSLEYPCSSLDEIQKALENAFGREGALLLVEAIKKRLAR